MPTESSDVGDRNFCNKLTFYNRYKSRFCSYIVNRKGYRKINEKN